MTVLDVVTWPSRVLETAAAPVEEFDSEFQQFVASMLETMHHANGIGLAANQVGSLQRVFVVNIPLHEDEVADKQWWHDKQFVFVNPEIVGRAGKVRAMEGCVSFPGVYEWVDRSSAVRVSAFDQFGKPFEVEADGLLAICIQHELDHLDGIVFTKRMSRLKANLIRRKMQKRAVTDADRYTSKTTR